MNQDNIQSLVKTISDLDPYKGEDTMIKAKELLKTLEEVKDDCDRADECLYCKHHVREGAYKGCKLQMLRVALASRPDNWDLELVEELLDAK